MQDTKQIARALDEIAALLEFSGESRYKARAYERGARVVSSLGDDLATLVEEQRLADMEGIGAALSRQITELWNTGDSALLRRLRSEHPVGAAELVQVEGLTPRRIRALHAALAITSVAQLRDACVAQQIRGVRGFGVKTEQRLLAAAERWLSRVPGETRILLAEARAIAARFERQLVDGGLAEAVLSAGALRRGEETLAELQLVVVGKDSDVLDQLARLPNVARVERERRVVHLSQGVPLVLHFAERSDAALRLLHATGSEAHVQALTARASERGLTLTHQALHTPSGAVCSMDSETAIYQTLDLRYVPPELRTGQGELEQAADAGFDDLISVGDIKGMVHCHTLYSDGKNSIEEMALAAQAMGMKYLTITDHSPSAHYAGGLTLDLLKQQWDEIAAVQECVQIRILRGTESDILADGSLDYPEDVLAQFDVVIASIHGRFRMDRNAMTQRLLRAMSLPVFKVWGHALGRLLLHREPFECDVPAVLDALAASRGAIEINADPHRLDLAPAWIPLARERGIPFVISVDAHSTRGLHVLDYGATMARRGGVQKHEVLNTLSAQSFAERVRPA